MVVAAAAIAGAATLGSAAIQSSSSGGGSNYDRNFPAGFRIQGGDLTSLQSNTPAFRIGFNNNSGGTGNLFATRLNTPGLAALRSRFGPILAGYQKAEGLVNPGAGALTQYARNQGLKSIGDLRASLARRKVLGSSFANDALARANAEVTQSSNLATLQEIDAYTKILNQEYTTIQTELARDLSESKFAFGVQQGLLDIFRGAASAVQTAATTDPFAAGLSSLGGQFGGAALQTYLNQSASTPTNQQVTNQAAYDVFSNPATQGLF